MSAGGNIVWNLDINDAKFKSGLDSAKKGASDAGKAIEKNISGGSKASAQSFEDAMGRVAKSATVAFAVVSAAVIGTVTKSVQAFAEFEQLVGGVDTLFKKSSKTVQGYAENAYKTAGLSANQYMSTVTSFSASLLQGLGGDTKKAAKIADLAVTDMSDNANKMGTDMGMIQNAYQGFAKDNFMMLDNLKLGYGGTATEMARLVNESGVMGKSFKATAENVKDVPFDKLILAINKVQTELGITGTTAKEASSTISGSLNSAKASWQNLLTGLSNPDADVSALFKQFKESAMVFADNVIPAIKTALKSLGTVIADVWRDFLKNNPAFARFLDIAKQVAGVIAILLIPAMIRYIALQAIAGTQALIAGAKMLAGWLMALGPIGLIMAAVGALAFLIYSNWDSIKVYLGKFWTWLKSVFTSGLNWIKRNWDLIAGIMLGPVGLAVVGIIRNFDKIKSAFKGAMNWVISKWNDLSFTIGGGEVFGRKLPSVTLNTPNVPFLADGGIVSSPTLAMIGEGSEPEAVVPLSKLKDIGGGGGVTNNIGTINISKEVDGERWLQKLSRQTDTRSMGLVGNTNV